MDLTVAATTASTIDVTTPCKSTDFQLLVRARAEAAANWLVRSIEACNGQGSATFYSRWYRPLRGWAWPYPETTGYIIPTLIDYSKRVNRPELAQLAVQQADWIMSLQFENGALPGGAVVRGHKASPSIFNTGQMILGLLAAGDHAGQAKYLESAVRAARWLAEEVDPNAGTWTSHAYVPGYSPAYYTRVCWPMLEVCARTKEKKTKEAAVRVLETIKGWQLRNGAIRNWGFRPDAPAFTHTIAYAIRGFLESARLLGEEGVAYWAAAIKSAEALRRRRALGGRLAGAYDLELKGTYWYTCLTGNCQMSLVWMKIYDATRDIRSLNAAIRALEFVIRHQRMHTLDPNVHGAIAGSSPLWGRYLTLRYPNWAAKFYLDALIEVDIRLQHLPETDPCALWQLPSTE